MHLSAHGYVDEWRGCGSGGGKQLKVQIRGRAPGSQCKVTLLRVGGGVLGSPPWHVREPAVADVPTQQGRDVLSQ